MIKIEVVLHFDFDEDEIGIKARGQKLLDGIREMIEEAAVEEDFSKNCKVVDIKFREEEVEPF